MIRRILCFLLAVVMVLGMLPLGVHQVAAAETRQTSDACIELIKKFEGFTAKPFYDYAQYSVGYGTACKPGDYPNGITKAQADQLLRKEIEKVETYLNRFATKYSLVLSQQQYDALISFTYNLGTNWMNNDSTFRTAVISGACGNDFIFAITMWCNAGGVINNGLVKRRLAEANLYLNGIYAADPPASYRYVIFDNNLESAVTTVKIQGFDANQTDKLRSVPSKAGYLFLGWYDKAEGGKWITTVGADTGNTTLYGHWQEIEADNASGTPARYVRYASSGQVTYDVPNGFEKRVCAKGEKLTVVADYMDPNGIKWGRLEDNSWINLTKTKEAATELPGEAVNLKVVVTASDVNIRKGPGTSYSKVGKAQKGQELMLTRVQQGGMYLWGQFSGGWICLDYTDYVSARAEMDEGSAQVTACGEIIRTDKLNIRARPGTGSSIVGHYSRGDQVKITQRQQVGSTTWGKTDKGWISLYYVKLTEAEEKEETETAKPESGEPSDTDKMTVIATGTVTDCGTLRIRVGAGTKYDRVGSLARGTRVEIYEIVTVGSQLWGRISKGWICLSYVKLDSESTGSENDGNESDGEGRTGTVYNCSGLNIRAGAGVKYAKVGRLARGTTVKILETTIAGGQRWGRISRGWVCMDYISLSETSSDSDDQTGSTGQTAQVNQTGVITGAAQVRIRKAPGVNNAQVGILNKGDKVVILETTRVGTATWGRTEKGWVHMHYVRLSSTKVPEGTVVRTVTEKLNIRSGAGISYEIVGKYTAGTQVFITAQTKVGGTTWGKTDKGWISMYYVE